MSETVALKNSPAAVRDTPQPDQPLAATTEQIDSLALHLKRKAEQAAETLPGEPPHKRSASDDPH